MNRIILDITGLTTTSIAIIMNTLIGWFAGENINQNLTILLSFFGLIFLVIRTYNAFKNGIMDRKIKRIDRDIKNQELKKSLKDNNGQNL
jgi:hypothetical protein